MNTKKNCGMHAILDGFLKYRSKGLYKEFHSNNGHCDPHSIIISCVDSRIVLSRVTQTGPGEAFVSRNPGNLIPDYSVLDPKTPRAEEAAIELACLWNDIDTLVICGHSDCKAMNLVHRNISQPVEENGSESLLKNWLMSNSEPTIKKFLELEKSNFKKPLNFSITETQNFQAYIDPENNYGLNDKFSQINTLTQLENLKNYKFMKTLLDQNKIHAFALWFDIYCGDVYCFSFREKKFVKLNEETYESLITQGLHLISS